MLYVIDANVLIDLHCGNLIAPTFSLPARFVAPDVVLAELATPGLEMLIDLGLEEGELAGPQVTAVMKLAGRYPRPSRIDLFALQLVIVEQAVLLTGDRDLRAAAEEEGVEVHGTLWLMDELVSRSIIGPGVAAVALRQLEDANPRRRLPANEVELRLKNWETSRE